MRACIFEFSNGLADKCMGKKEEFVTTENNTISLTMECQRNNLAFETNMIFNSENIWVLLLTNYERQANKDLF